ncbi:MAG: hypothetical protein AAF471_06285, partial [Myxococcota bacterium]
LLVYAACEYRLRKVLAEKELTVPDQKKKPTQRPTMRWVFAVVRGDSCVGGSRGPQAGVGCQGASLGGGAGAGAAVRGDVCVEAFTDPFPCLGLPPLRGETGGVYLDLVPGVAGNVEQDKNCTPVRTHVRNVGFIIKAPA